MESKNYLLYPKISIKFLWGDLGYLYILKKKIFWVSGKGKKIIKNKIEKKTVFFWIKSVYRDELFVEKKNMNLISFCGFFSSEFSKINFFFQKFYLKPIFRILKINNFCKINQYRAKFGNRMCNYQEIFFIIKKNTPNTYIYCQKRKENIERIIFKSGYFPEKFSCFLLEKIKLKKKKNFILMDLKNSHFFLIKFHSDLIFINQPSNCKMAIKEIVKSDSFFFKTTKIYLKFNKKKKKYLMEIFFFLNIQNLFFKEIIKDFKEKHLGIKKFWIYSDKKLEKKIKLVTSENFLIIPSIFYQMDEILIETIFFLKKKFKKKFKSRK
ncbi:hypothetical protein CMESO_41 (nucleomorph) [Chroomonas mesostigmatica CCMP1168]|uniref:Uncharacterized protein n=1 Tax=Chroomonas mesostigmatica CCMP1168 TaxID=1195612 RepID=J7G2K4_9CRYP|nr:hypothetical protein CMESO_41 [Chroomonas mesostigmatica CCMP1168]